MIMKHLINIFIIIPAIAILLGGCNNGLDEKLYSDLSADKYKYTEADIAASMSVVYANLKNAGGMWNNNAFDGTGWYGAQEITSDETVLPANGSGWDDGGVFKRLQLHNWNSEQANCSSMWLEFYAGIAGANRVIRQFREGILPSKPAYVSEIKVLRAYYLWQLLDNFGDAILDTSALAPTLTKSPRLDVYNFVVKEISDAIPNLSADNNVLMYGRFNKWAAKTLLANIYLNAGVYSGSAKWTQCLKECDDVIASGKYSLEATYKSNFITNNQGSVETIFAIPFDETLAQGFYLQMMSWNAAFAAKSNMQASPWGFGAIQGVPQFFHTYDKEDTRFRDSYLVGQQYAANGDKIKASDGTDFVIADSIPDGLFTAEKEGCKMNKWEVKTGAQGQLSNDFQIFRYAQVLMMKAECLLRTGDANGAAALVTQVRQRDFKNNPSKATVTGAELLADSKIKYGYLENYKVVDKGDQTPVQYGRFLDELGWEFAWEAFRRRDMIRFGTFTKKSWASHKPNGDYRTVFPIPQSAINANPKLVQNPAYK
jgi:starch-binding outer membrane protein, SusD/RagB family